MTRERVAERTLYQFIIEAGIRLRAKNATTCSAIKMMHILQRRPIIDSVCNYSLACAALLLAGKHQEDTIIGIRDVINVSWSLLHPNDDILLIDDFFWKMREGITSLEFALLRELAFKVDFEHPFKALALYIDQLSHWMPREFDEHKLAQKCIALARDLYIAPNLVDAHSPESLAIACIAIILEGHDIKVPHSDLWFEILHKSLCKAKLEGLMCEILDEIDPPRHRHRR